MSDFASAGADVEKQAFVSPPAARPNLTAGGAALRVLKFGGSSLATPDRIKHVARIVLDAADGTAPLVIVVSAFQDVTNQLLECANLAGRHSEYEPAYEAIAARHRSAVQELFGGKQNRRIRTAVDQLLRELREDLDRVRRSGRVQSSALDAIASFGERLSATIVAAHLDRFRRARYVDARRFIVTDDQYTHANVLFSETIPAVRRYFSRLSTSSERPILVATGFIGRTREGRTTTVGRNGSDYTAAIIGAALDASIIEIWTDVDGVMSADPKTVASAFVLPQITYEHALEMSNFGAKVLYPGAIAPAVAGSIPILVKNTFNSGAPGTLITAQPINGYRFATGVSSIRDVTLLTLRHHTSSSDLLTAERLFRAFSSCGVNVIVISLGSSEHAIRIALKNADADRAVDAINEEFGADLRTGLLELDYKRDQALVAVVAHGIDGRPDVVGKAFEALGRHRIRISAVVQAASGRNVSYIVDALDEARAVNAVHQGIFANRLSLGLALVGVGNVGGALLRQFAERQSHFLRQGFDIRVIALADSKRFLVNPDGIDLARWREALDASPHAMDARTFASTVARLELPHAAMIDCTADAGIVDAYPDFINANLHIVTPNKRANVLPWHQYQSLLNLLAGRQKRFFYETNVGAGLPVISTLQGLLASGDEIRKLEGIFSGTLSYVFNSFDGRTPFSALVCEAQRKGLTEPDPREDLSGEDVARKLLILARQSGLKMDLEDVQVQSLVGIPDRDVAERFDRARSCGAVLRYVGSLENGVARARLQEVPRDSPLAATRYCDNVIAFTTKRYAATPLVIQGPGAGGEVTAAGVLGDVLKLLHQLPA